MFRHPPSLLSFISALLIANVSGPQYVYPIYGSYLYKRLAWSTFEASIVSTACFIGVSFSGPLCSWSLERLGVKRTLRLSSAIVFFGFFLVAQTYAGRLPNHFLLVTIYFILTGFAGAASFLCALDCQSRNFKQHRGLAVGMTTASIGISGLVFSQINDTLFKLEDIAIDATLTEDATYHFLIFLAISMSLGILTGSFFLNSVDYRPVAVLPTTDQPEPKSGIQFLINPIGFALFCTLFVTLGIGYVYLANIGQILQGTHPVDLQHIRNSHITLFSLGNCASRAFFGALGDVLHHKLGISRLWIFVFAVLSLIISLHHLSDLPEDLTPYTLLISMTYGISFGVAPAIITDIGSSHKAFARNWGWMLYAPALGSQFYNILFNSFDIYQIGQWSGWVILVVLLLVIHQQRTIPSA
ncbi:hypothetical protein RMCBS344292_11120 [Rhizopus microsporus]|nr:hypothetical protein RMCBS344292_11120 [Rhizopus microsporus]